MPNRFTDWISTHADSLALAIICGLGASSVTAFLRGSKGAAVLVSHVATAVLCIAAYPAVLAYFNEDWRYAPLVGVVCGATAFAVFRFLISISDRIASKGENIADKVIDRVVPGENKP